MDIDLKYRHPMAGYITEARLSFRFPGLLGSCDDNASCIYLHWLLALGLWQPP